MEHISSASIVGIIFVMILFSKSGASRRRDFGIHEHYRQKRAEQQFCAIRPEKQCCLGSPCCGPPEGGCCCDTYCLEVNDCCPDYWETCQDGPCSRNEEIKLEEKRSVDYVTNFEIDVPFSDEDLNETLWYKVISDNGDAMPTYPPGLNHCGTVYPIWLNGNMSYVFENDATSNETTPFSACQQTENDTCATALEINITRCSDGSYSYKLKPTPTNSSYCFGSGSVRCETGLSSESGFYPGCSGSFPNDTVYPKVTALLIEGDNYTIGSFEPSPSLNTVFACVFNEITNTSYVYDVHWYINGEFLKNDTNVLFEDINDTFLIPSDWVGKYRMNMEVVCSVRVRKMSDSLPSPFHISSVFHAGVFPEKFEYTVIENEHITIPFRSTVPVACISSNEQLMLHCKQNFYIFQPNYQENTGSCVNNINTRDIVFNTEFCGFKFGTLDWNDTKYLDVYGYSDGKYNSYFRVTYIRLSTHAVNAHGGAMWINLTVPDIKVTVLDKDSVMTGRMCQSSNDPHITTFDGIYYHYMEIGEFVLYRNSKGPYWVHALFTNCGFGWTGSSCHCGIAVRSKNSLFVLRTCSRVSRTEKFLLQQPFTEMRTCDVNDLLVVNTGNRYTIKLPTGTEIRFTVSVYQMFISSITIKPSVHDIGVARGLCGVPSPIKDTSDDFTNRETDTVTPEKEFADSWKIDRHTMHDEQLFIPDPSFLTEDVAVEVNTTESNFTLPHFCACEKEAGPYDDLDLFYTLQCNMTEPTQVCSTNSQSTQTAFVTSCTTSTSGRKKRSTHSRIVRRSVDDSDDVIDSVPLEFEEDSLDQNSTLQEPEFRNGWTEEGANKTCEDQIKSLVRTEIVSEVSGSGNDAYVQFCIQSCILDIKLIADTTYIQDTIEAMQTLTLMEASRIENLTQQRSDDGSMTMMDYITSVMCNCSGNGNCSTDGVCSCNYGFIGDDCSIPTSMPPSIGSLPEGGFCKTNKRACLSTNVFGIFLSTDVWCKRQHFKIVNNSIELTGTTEGLKALYRNPNMISISLKNSRKKRSTTELSGPEGFELSFSYDGVNYGNTTRIIIYDEECYSCTKDPLVCVIVSTCPALSTKDITTESSTLLSTNIKGSPLGTVSTSVSVSAISTTSEKESTLTTDETELTSTTAKTELITTTAETEPRSAPIETDSTSTSILSTTPTQNVFTTTTVEIGPRTTSAKTETSTTPVETVSSATPIVTESRGTFVQTELNKSPVATDSTVDPLETQSTTTPMKRETATRPVKAESTTTPTKRQSTTSPVETESTTSLVETEFTTTPMSRESASTPMKTESATTHVETVSTTTPTEKESSTTSVQTESDKNPVAIESTTNSLVKESTTTPMKRESTTNFVETESITTPMKRESTTTHMKRESTTNFIETESTTTPVKKESNSVKTESTTTPMKRESTTTPMKRESTTTFIETESAKESNYVKTETTSTSTTIHVVTERTTTAENTESTTTSASTESNTVTVEIKSTSDSTTAYSDESSIQKVTLSEGLKAIIGTVSVVVLVTIIICVTFISYKLCRQKSSKYPAHGFFKNVEQWMMYEGKDKGEPKPVIFESALRANLSNRQKYM